MSTGSDQLAWQRATMLAELMVTKKGGDLTDDRSRSSVLDRSIPIGNVLVLWPKRASCELALPPRPWREVACSQRRGCWHAMESRGSGSGWTPDLELDSVHAGLFKSQLVNSVNTKKISHQIFRNIHGVLNEVYLQKILYGWAVNRETNLMCLLNPWFATVVLQ